MQTEESRRRTIRIVLVCALFALLVLLTVFASHWVLGLRNPDRMEWFRSVVESMGIGGWFLLLAIQFVQIVIAFIPGGPIQVIAGALFGPWLGMLACFTGTVLATATVFWLVSRWGRGIVSLFVGERELFTYRFLQDTRRLERSVIVLFFIPGTPKDALTYLFALTRIPMGRFLLLSTLARLPAVLTSVLAGDRIMNREWGQAALLFLGITAISLAGFFLHKKILRKHGKNA